MKNNEFNFNLPIDSYAKATPKSSLIQTYNKNKDHFAKVIKDQRKDWPEYMTLRVVNVYQDNTFDLASPDGEHIFERVGAIDPRAKDYYQVGKAVTVRFHNVNGGRPYIKFGYGFMGDVQDVSIVQPSTIKYWTQSKGSWLQNQHAPDACRLYSPWDTTGAQIYSFPTKEGPATDLRALPYGVVTYKDADDNARIAVAYMMFSADGSFTKYHKIDVIDLAGALVVQYSWDSTAVYPFGNLDSYSHFSVNPDNTHFTLVPNSGFGIGEDVLLRAWGPSGDTHTRSDTIAGLKDGRRSYAHDNVLLQSYSVSYTTSGGTPSSTRYVWPLTAPVRTPVVTGSVRGWKRTAAEALLDSFNLDPSVLCTLPVENRKIYSGSPGGSSPPASVSTDAWLVVSLEATLVGSLGYSDASWAALANLYNSYTSGSSSPPTNFNPYNLITKSRLNITKLNSQDGSVVWRYSIDATPMTPAQTTGLLTQTEQFYLDYGPAQYDPTRWGGRVTENSRNQLSPARNSAGSGFLAWPAWYFADPSPSFSWPRYDYLPAGIAMMPQVPNNIRAGRALPFSTPYYSGQLNALPVVQDYAMNSGPAQALYSDPVGNLYFTYCKPYTFLTYGDVSYDYNFAIHPVYTTIEGHFPALDYSWTTHQVSLSPAGELRWERDISQYETVQYNREITSPYLLSSPAAGGTSGLKIPIPNNVLLQLPCSKFLLVVREIRGLGAEYRPDLWLEIVNSATGVTVQFIYLPLAFDTLASDIDVDGHPYANAGERNYEVIDCKMRTATTEAGIDWCVVYTTHTTRDGTTIPGTEHHIDLYQAPTDGSIGEWSAVGSWTPNIVSGDHAPYTQFWDTLCISDGSVVWAEGYGGSWDIYKRDL